MSRHEWQRAHGDKDSSGWERCSRCHLYRRAGDLFGEPCIVYLTPRGAVWGTLETAETDELLACREAGR